MKSFEEIDVIGDGAFGVVTKCKDKNTRKYVAIKKMKQKFTSFEECLNLKEVKSLRKIHHENVVRLLQVFRENEHLFLVFELLGQSLLKTMNEKVIFTENEIRYTMKHLLQGLNYIHKQGFFHRDIKPENLLWGNQTLKIADFGLAREIRSRPPYTEYVGTRWYRAPEIIFRHEFYNSPVDIWSAGCIMAELYIGKPLFQGASDQDQLFKICNILGTPNSFQWSDGVILAQRHNIKLPQTSGTHLSSIILNASPEAIDLISQMLSYDPMKRPSANSCLKHQFFNGQYDSPIRTIQTNNVHPNNNFSRNYVQSSLIAPSYIKKSKDMDNSSSLLEDSTINSLIGGVSENKEPKVTNQGRSINVFQAFSFGTNHRKQVSLDGTRSSKPDSSFGYPLNSLF